MRAILWCTIFQYTDALNDKEYKKYRADKLCQEKTRIAVDVEDKFGRIKVCWLLAINSYMIFNCVCFRNILKKG